MKRSSKVLLFSFLMFAFSMVVLSSNVVCATSENNISLVKTENSKYIVYVENLNETFKYSVSKNDEEPVEYDVSSLDSNNNNVALIDLEILGQDTNNVYLWIKPSSGEVVKKQIDLNDYIDFEDVSKINQLTHLISVRNDEQQETITDSESKTKTVITGKIVISDDNTKSYDCALLKLPSTDKVNKIVDLVEQINNFSENVDMYIVTTKYKEIITLYKDLARDLKFEKVENMEIMQPEDSLNGDRYLMFLRKLDGDRVIQEDIQILTCKRLEDEGQDKIVTQKEVEKAVKLPITGGNLFLICGFIALVVALIILLVIKKKSANKRTEN